MAEQQTRNNAVNTLFLGMNKDVEPSMIKEGQYTHAINSQLNSFDGDVPFISPEQSNTFLSFLPYTFIGSISLLNKKHVIFTTDNKNSEIGIYNEVDNSYTKVVNNTCLNFQTSHLIKGISKQNRDGSESIYWCDNFNNNRTLNLNNIPYTYTFADDECLTKIFSNTLSCEELELNALIKIPCLTLESNNTSGSLRNGAYQVGMCYSINGQNITDYYGITTTKSIFSHEDLGGSLEVKLENLDTEFKEFKLICIVTINQQTTVYEIGTYSTTQKQIVITNINESNITIPLQDIYLQKVINSKAENVITSNDYLIWSSPTTKAELDYQLSALDITAKWVAYAVPIEDRNFDLQSYMRDEIYALALGWKYTDGTRTNKYPLIGRRAAEKELAPVSGEDNYELFLKNCDKDTTMKYWQVYNTAKGNIVTTPLDKCEYKIIGEGDFGYYESTEKYPDNKYLYGELACTPIRLFRFPDDSLVPRVLKDSTGKDTHIIHLGIKLYNIKHPEVSNVKLKNIQGYEVFRSVRDSNKTVLGKGLLFNMGEYEIPTSTTTKTKAFYPNYPFNDLNIDGFLSRKQTVGKIGGEGDYSELGTFSKNYYTFHSPSFSFNKPSFGSELKIEGVQFGNTNSKFVDPYGHPKNKLITDIGFVAAMIIGLAEAFLATREPVTTTFVAEAFNLGIGAGTGTTGTVVPSAAMVAAINAYKAGLVGLENIPNPLGGVVDTTRAAMTTTLLSAASTAAGLPFVPGRYSYSEQKTSSLMSSLPKAIRLLNDAYLFAYYFQKGTQTGLDFIRSFSGYQQYGKQINSYCYYDSFRNTTAGKKRRYIDDISYLYPTMQTFDGVMINNFKRESSVILKLNRPLDFPTVKDNSRQTMSQAKACDSKEYQARASSYYAAIKQRNDALYGQIENIQWIDTGYCNFISKPSTKYNSDIVLGGDTFINRFTVKRKFQYFNQFGFQENDGFEFDYRKYINVAYPRYWMDTDPYDLSEAVSLNPVLPNDKLNLDCSNKNKKFKDKLKSAFVIKNRHFYLSNNGVVDFYVESEVNLANRDWEEEDYFRHYDKDTYSDLYTLFRTDYLTYDNRYIYDQSFSKQLVENTGVTQNIYYDPLKENTVYTKLKNRVYWSLPNNKDLVVDNWKNYLPNNYYDFPLSNGNLTGMKALDRVNIAFFFDNAGPHLHQSTDQLTTDNNIKINLGDGGLFSRNPQAIVNTDIAYGNSTTRFAYTNTQYGVFYPSEKQGRVFLLQGNNLKEISRENMHFWFQENLAFNLLKTTSNFKDKDNTVKGIGFNTTFDNNLELYYLSKIDYSIREEFKDVLKYDEVLNTFYFIKRNNVRENVVFKNPDYFNDCSWTISYSPKLEAWVSFHDWYPNSIIQTENHFISITNPNTKLCSLWNHNQICYSHCKYFDIQHSWDIEYVIQSGSTSILSSIEYYLETYLYEKNCTSKHHLLDYNFTYAYIYNTEQVSGKLNLNLGTKLKMSEVLNYPRINTDTIDIVYHKEEQKLRFNQFWDITKDRGEFSGNYIPQFIVSPNGYQYGMNPNYLNYNKPLFERKRLRHNWFKVYFSKMVDVDNDLPYMKFKLSSSKLLNSPR